MFNKITIFISLLFCSLTLCASELEIHQDEKLIKKFNITDWKNKKLSSDINGSFSSKSVYNIHRRVQSTYEGFELIEVLDKAFGKKNWRKNKKIRFFAKDGIVKEANLKEMLSKTKKHVGLIAIRNKGKKDLDVFVKGINTIYPGPFYLVWTGFTDKDYSGGSLKWPYHLSKIVLVSK